MEYDGHLYLSNMTSASLESTANRYLAMEGINPKYKEILNKIF